MYKLAICPHDIEIEKNRLFWESFSKNLENTLKKSIKLILFKNYYEEKEKFDRNYELFYANPITAYKLYQEGYKPLAKLKNHKDAFVIIGEKNNSKERNILTLVYLETHLLPILYFHEFDFINTKIKYLPTQENIYYSVKNKEADFGIMYKENYENINDEEKVPIIKELYSNFSHFLMVKPEYYNEIKGVIKDFKEFELVDEENFLETFNVNLQIRTILKIKEFFDTIKEIYEIPFIGVAVYKEKIIYANDNFQKLTGFTIDELQNMSIMDIVTDEYKKKKQKIINRRLKGEYFSISYEELKIRTKNNIFKYALGFSSTIFYKESYAGFMLLVDITKQKRYEKLYKALRNVNRAIISALTEEELFKIICRTLVNELDIKFVWIGKPDKDNKYFEEIYKCGDDKGYLNVIKIKVDCDSPESKGPTSSAYREGKIFINPNTKNNPLMLPWREEMLKRGFLSSAAIPIMKNGKVIAVLNIYAKEPFYFEEENRSLLKDLKRDLSFAIEKIETIKNSLILKNAIEKSDEWVVIVNDKGQIEYANNYVYKLSGYSKNELIGKSPKIFKSGYFNKEFYKNLWKTILSGRKFEAIFVNRKKDGSLFYLDEKIIPIKFKDNKKFIGIAKDITKEIILEEEIEKLKHYDVMTGLYNINGFRFIAKEFIKKHRNKKIVLIKIDIDNFSIINKKYGIEVGDEILKEFANRLNISGCIVARTGADDFSILCIINEIDEIIKILKKLENIQKMPFKKDIYLDIRGGISIYPIDGKNFEQLYGNASIALKKAHESKEKFKFYSKEYEENIEKFIRGIDLIKKAIEENLFVFFYQPYFSIKDGSIAGAEALVRIKDKNKIYPPNEFIDYLEGSPYLEEFENWALKEVVSKINKWDIPISVNISARTFKNPNFKDKVFKYGENLKNYLTIEITERLFAENIENTKKIIEELKKLENVRVAMDDFGTGYSSLVYLNELNTDVLKIDISFVRKLDKSLKTKEVVKFIIEVAKLLNMKTIAEGVENEEQFNILKELGCDFVQGFLFEKPLEEEEFEKKYFKIKS
ncbi:EAL domain-containing protein [Caminibacter profundus]